jgi:hypothetical protein
MCRNNGLDSAPICAFERWICNAKMRDEAALRLKLGSGGNGGVAGGEGGQGGGCKWEPVLPVASQTVWIDKELVDDLVNALCFCNLSHCGLIQPLQMRCGVAAAAAAVCASNLCSIALKHSAVIDSMLSSSSGKQAQVHVEQHKHTLDVTCGCHPNILKINTAHYNKLRHL